MFRNKYIILFMALLAVGFMIFGSCMYLRLNFDSYIQTKDYMIGPSDARDKDYTAITISSFSAEPGDKIQVPVMIRGNPGILGMTLTINYDEDCLSMDKVEDGEVFEDVLTLTKSKFLGSGARFVWHGLNIADKDIRDGRILNMYFTISKTAKPGKYPIRLTFGDEDIVDKNLKNVMVIVEQGIITIK